MDDSCLIKDTAGLYLEDDEYGDYPKSSLWWEQDYDPPDYFPYNIQYDFEWDYTEGDI